MPRALRINYPLIMGILNVTPDSFSDGGRYLDAGAAVEHARAMVMDGAHIIDMGAESSRPGSDPVPPAEQLRRLLPVLKAFRKKSDAPVSIDTWSAVVAEACLAEGATTINDITAVRGDKRMMAVLKKSNCDIVLMHMPATPKTMQKHANYTDVMATLIRFFNERTAACIDAGINPKRLIIDPGVGFGKTADHNFEIIRRIGELRAFGLPVLLGLSRKKFLGTMTNEAKPENRVTASIVAGLYAVNNGADILRVHDVKEHVASVCLMNRLQDRADIPRKPSRPS